MPLLTFPDGELDTAAFLGHVTDRSVRVWTRAPHRGETDPLEVTLQVNGHPTIRTAIASSQGTDWTAAATLELNEPAPDADFVVHAAGQELRGRLAPSLGQPAAFTFGFGSCHQPFEATGDTALTQHEGARIYAPMRALLEERNASFLLLVGDQVYSDGTNGIDLSRWATDDHPTHDDGRPDEELLEAYRELYRGYFNQADFRRLLETFPSYLMWDDHDIADSWGSRIIKTDTDRRLFAAARRTFREYQVPHNPPLHRPEDGAHHFSFTWGDVGFLALDLRNDRDWSEGVILKDDQWAAIDRFLEDATNRDLRTVFLVSTIPLIHFPPAIVRTLQWIPGGKGSDVRDRWDAHDFREQRDQLIGRIGAWQHARQGRQVVILSGDVHAGAAFHVSDPETHGQFHQWTSSSMSAPGGALHRFVNSVGPRRVNWGESRTESSCIGSDARNNFGIVEVQPADGGGHHLRFDLYTRTRGGLARPVTALGDPLP